MIARSPPREKTFNAKRFARGASGDVWRAAVAAQRDAVQRATARQRRSTAALAGGRPDPADNSASAGGMHGRDALARMSAHAAASGDASAGKRDYHAHLGFRPFVLLHWLCQLRLRSLLVGIIGRGVRPEAETFVPEGACYSPGLSDAAVARVPSST